VAASLLHVIGHGSMLMPNPRNAIDALTPPWEGGKHPPTGTIQPYSCACANGTSPCDSGQACFWFQQGCTIGCKACDNNGTRIPGWDHCPEVEKNFPRLLSKYRTANQNAAEGTVADVFRFNPWRAPGRAPVIDPCGVAGGTPTAQFNAAEYDTTVFAKQGDHAAAVLKPRPTGTVWRRGGNATVRWQLTANHGGGYQYRLCKRSATAPLTEDCFQATPLEFARPETHFVRFANASLDHEIPATLVTEGGGIGWMRNPKPATFRGCDRVIYDAWKTGHCHYGCPGCGAPNYPDDAACPMDSCSPYYPGTPSDVGNVPSVFPDHTPSDIHAFAIEDLVKVPVALSAGEYVVGFRYDCEQTSQIWTTCADITVV
jgi:hypothetical protein